MHGLIAALTQLVSHHPATALLVAFASAVTEALVVVGALVPGTALMMTVAGIAAAAGLPRLPFVLVAGAGAVVGDTVSWWVGHHFGTRLRRIWPLSRYPGVLARAERFFVRFGPPSVAVARFVPGLRAAVPLAAGMAGMAVRPFLLADVLSAAVWAPVHILPAQLAGLAIHRGHTGGWGGAALMAAALALVGAAAYGLHRFMRRYTTRRHSLPLAPDAGCAAARQSAGSASRSRRDVAAG